GKGLSAQNTSTIGAEKIGNWSLQNMREQEFIQELLADQPFIPKYFPFDVGINKVGAADFKDSVSKVTIGKPIAAPEDAQRLDPSILIIDTRHQLNFKRSHLKNSVNLMNDTKFETWLGSIVNPMEPFYLMAENAQVLKELIFRCAKIGYEKQIKMASVIESGNTFSENFDSTLIREQQDLFTIVDIRNLSEVKAKPIFKNALAIPLPELRERASEIPLNKPIVVHCAGGYRSAAGSSLLQSLYPDTKIYDLSEAVKNFQ
ncbi:MAG: MBL fold metallo-hydrolase, partial [Cytophagales bacterium]|nr:MBL fold metallo-hydrolase [Cytophagales bacterium]